MRNFEERLAEIHRRCEAVQANRKKRKKQILTVCIPFVLCTAIALPLILPKPKAETPGSVESAVLKEDVSNQANGNMSNSTSVTTPFTAIEITNLSQTYSLTNQTQIAQISDFVYNSTENFESYETQEDADGNPPVDNSALPEGDFLIRMYAGEEEKESYRLSDGCILVDNKTGKAYRLPGEEAEIFTELLQEAIVIVNNKTGETFVLE